MRIELVLFLIGTCHFGSAVVSKTSPSSEKITVSIDSYGMTVLNRYPTMDSFYRKNYDSTSFEFYLQHLKLKKLGEKVRLFNGDIKENYGVYSSVIDMKISSKDLQQCADAVMRLRAEYLYKIKKYDQIKFLFNGDKKYHSYLDYVKGDYTYLTFLKYMDYIFTYANTASLHQQLKPVNINQIQIGDVFVKKGNPFGHAVIVVDLIVNSKGDKKFMLAQSYMPAQETQILLNPSTQNVWYDIPLNTQLITPEWTFSIDDLRRW